MVKLHVANVLSRVRFSVSAPFFKAVKQSVSKKKKNKQMYSYASDGPGDVEATERFKRLLKASKSKKPRKLTW